METRSKSKLKKSQVSNKHQVSNKQSSKQPVVTIDFQKNKKRHISFKINSVDKATTKTQIVTIPVPVSQPLPDF